MCICKTSRYKNNDTCLSNVTICSVSWEKIETGRCNSGQEEKKKLPHLKSLSEESKSMNLKHRGRAGLGKGFFLDGH